MVAFLAMVESDEGYVGGVYFAHRAIEARRAVCDEWQDGELGGATVRRVPHFDQYEAKGAVPMSDMMLEGWWSECTNCWKKLTIDEQYDDDGNEFLVNPDDVIGDFGDACFCSSECQEEWKVKQDKKAHLLGKTENDLKAKIEAKFGVQDIEYTHFYAYIPMNVLEPFVQQAQVKFRVPECQHGGISYGFVVESGCPPEYQMSYARGDHDAVAKFFKDRTGNVLDTPAD